MDRRSGKGADALWSRGIFLRLGFPRFTHKLIQRMEKRLKHNERKPVLNKVIERCRLELCARMHEPEELMELSGPEVVKKYLNLRRSRRDAVEVIARSYFVRRQKLLQELKQRRIVAAVTGDGTNDASALHEIPRRRVDYGVPPGNSMSGTEVGAADYPCINDAGEDKAAVIFSEIVPPTDPCEWKYLSKVRNVGWITTPGEESLEDCTLRGVQPGEFLRNPAHTKPWLPAVDPHREYCLESDDVLSGQYCLESDDIGGEVTDEDAMFASVSGSNRYQGAGLVGHERRFIVPGRPGALNSMHGTLKRGILSTVAPFCTASTFLVQGVGAIAPETAPDRSLQGGSSTGTPWSITVVTVIVGIITMIVAVVLGIERYMQGRRQERIQTEGFQRVSSSLDLGFQQVCRAIEVGYQRLSSSQNIEKDDVGTGSASAALQPHAVVDIVGDQGETADASAVMQ